MSEQKELSDAYSSLKEKHVHLKGVIDDKNRQIKEQFEEIDRLRDKIFGSKAIKERKDTANARLHDLLREVRILKELNEDLRQKLDLSKRESDANARQVSYLQKQVLQLTIEKNALINMISSLQNVI